MNNFQNCNPRKTVSPSKNVPKPLNESSGNVHDKKRRKPTKEGKTEDKCDIDRPAGALKIFYESDDFSSYFGPRFEWSSAQAKKRIYKNIFPVKKNFFEDNDEGKIDGKKWQTREEPWKNKEKSNLYNLWEYQLEKNKPGKIIKPWPKPEKLPAGMEPTEKGEVIEKKTAKVAMAPVSTLYALRKALDPGKKPEKVKPEAKVHPPSNPTNATLVHKSSGKVCHTAPPAEVKASYSDHGKSVISEILKGHAQKMQPGLGKSCVQVKDSSQGFFQKLMTKEEKKEDGKKEAAPKKEKPEDKTKKPKQPAKDPGEPKQPAKDPGEPKEVAPVEEKEVEKRKMSSIVMKLPQSNELERRLKGSWEEPGFFPGAKEAKQDVDLPDEKKNKKTGKSGDDEEENDKKSEKRTTYTDQLLLIRTLGKDKKGGPGSEGPEHLQKPTDGLRPPAFGETPPKNNIVALTQPKSMTVSLTREISSTTNAELVMLKSAKHADGEHVIKTKATRSTELRDLVTQAVKEHKIFCIFDNHWYIFRPVREELLSRGWLEVIPDRKLIPRRRPPPMGPTYERDKAFLERNCNTLEAILAAKEAFADEIQETVSKSASFRTFPERPKPPSSSCITKKLSEESLGEALSLFRIIPPTTEKKKNNSEIREFVAKYQNTAEEKVKEKEKKAKEAQKEKRAKKEKPKPKEPVVEQPKPGKTNEESSSILPKGNFLHRESLQMIKDVINDNKKTIMQAAAEIKSLEGRILSTTLGALLDTTKNLPSIESAEAQNIRQADKDKADKEKSDQGKEKTFFTDAESRMISKIIQSTNARIHFMWLSIKPSIHLKCFNYSPEIVNKFQRTTFCTKIGLWSHLNSIQWYAHEVHFPAKSPRMYNTGEADDLQAFFQDFQLTACIGMLKWLSDTFFDRGMKAVQTKKGKVPLKAFEFAIKQCEKYMRFKDNEDLGILEEPKALKEEWNTFLQWFYIITNDHGKVQESSSAQLMVVYTKAIETLKLMKRHWPEMDIDGRLNIWIMKPYCASCGRGIFMTNNVYYIGQHSKYIVQKYIERPLLIYNTKFDIRQWFLITKLTPLEIWMYKECYLRFCTQPFALRNLHESVHLSNNSVQRKYVNTRDPGLPDQNMWDSHTFQLYLKTIGHQNTWEDIIYPGMRDAIVSTMLAAQDTFDGPRRSWFEVYGADFMLSANLKEGPWLIEINENPAMDPSTKVTARLCPQMLRDVIKVVVDKRNNKNASTGEWELVYRQNYSPSFGTVDLDVKGRKIARVPQVSKPNFNLPPHPSSSPSYYKRSVSDESDPSKVYEIVKGYDSRKNSRGDGSFGGKPQDKTSSQNAKAGDRDPASSYLRIRKSGNVQSLTQNFKKTNEKKEENHEEKEKVTTHKQEETGTGASANRSVGTALNYCKQPLSVTSREAAKVGQREKERPDSKVIFPTSVSPLPPKENKKATGQSMSNFESDKYIITKFYKV